MHKNNTNNQHKQTKQNKTKQNKTKQNKTKQKQKKNEIFTTSFAFSSDPSSHKYKYNQTSIEIIVNYYNQTNQEQPTKQTKRQQQQ